MDDARGWLLLHGQLCRGLRVDAVVSGSYRDPDRNHEPSSSGSTWLDQKVPVANTCTCTDLVGPHRTSQAAARMRI